MEATKQALEGEVLGMISEITGKDRGGLRAQMLLMGKEMGVDSLAMLRLLVKIEERFPERMKNKDPNEIDFTTVETLVEFLVA